MRRPHALSSWREVSDDWQRPVGWASAGPPGKCPVLSLPLFYFLFSNYFDLFWISRNTNSFCKILTKIVGTIWIISNSPQLFSEVFKHLKYLYTLKAPIQIQYDLTQKSINVQEICSSFLAEVFTFIINHEHFQKAFWVYWKWFYVEPIWFDLVLGFDQSPFQISMKIKHDASKMQTLGGTRS